MTDNLPHIQLGAYAAAIQKIDPIISLGHIVELVGLVVESRGPSTSIGDFVEIHTSTGRRVPSQVVGFRAGNVLSMPLEETDGLGLGNSVIARPGAATVPVGRALLGRVIDGFGNPMDGPPIEAEDYYSLCQQPVSPLQREHIEEPLETGIRAIDGLLTCGKGQRIGLFGGSGVGKSTLLGAMARQSKADVNVICLVGERNREVRGFLEQELGPDGAARSVVVCSTSDRPAPLRVRACFVALAVAEYFRDQGKAVLLVMDSITRLAMAQREIGLAAGEPPSQKGYTPSVFQLLPKICERAGNFGKGSITAFFTVLVDGDDFNEPICDAVRAILDGHIILSRELGASGHFPAIQVLDSVSRLQSRVATKEQKENARRVREALASYRSAEDLIQLGAYASGSNPRLDASIRLRGDMMKFLRQDSHEPSDFAATLNQLNAVAQQLPS